MASPLVRIGHHAHAILKEIAGRTGESAPDILDKALEEYRRKCFLDDANRAFADLRKDDKAWRKELEERKAWDAASSPPRGRRRP